ncbi:MAG: 16S rRNA (guanine(966)-N(2))-methyltransferase RsmD [Actinomycetes bacterium]
MTRIIAGVARGRRLQVPPNGTRPTSDRVREALFSSIESTLLAEGRAWSQVGVLDLFAGTGALGLEALSRGAARAVFVEKSRAAAKAVAANIAVVGLPAAEVLIRDARQLAAEPARVGADLCFADPPYEWSATDLSDLLAGLGDHGWLAPGALVIVERPAKDPASPLPGAWPEGRRRAYGDTALWYGHVLEPETTRQRSDDRPS